MSEQTHSFATLRTTAHAVMYPGGPRNLQYGLTATTSPPYTSSYWYINEKRTKKIGIKNGQHATNSDITTSPTKLARHQRKKLQNKTAKTTQKQKRLLSITTKQALFLCAATDRPTEGQHYRVSAVQQVCNTKTGRTPSPTKHNNELVPRKLSLELTTKTTDTRVQSSKTNVYHIIVPQTKCAAGVGT